MSSEGWSNSVMADAGGGSRGTHKHTTHVGTLYVPYPSIPHSSCQYPHVIISCLICPRVCITASPLGWSTRSPLHSRFNPIDDFVFRSARGYVLNLALLLLLLPSGDWGTGLHCSHRGLLVTYSETLELKIREDEDRDDCPVPFVRSDRVSIQ